MTDRFGNPMKDDFEIAISFERVDLCNVRYIPKIDKNGTLHVLIDHQLIAATPIEIEKGFLASFFFSLIFILTHCVSRLCEWY